MIRAPSFLRLAVRQFWVLFGVIWFVVGTGVFIGGLVALSQEMDDPAGRSEKKQKDDRIGLAVMLGMGGVFGGVGGFLLMKGLRRVRDVQHLYRHGVRIEATVTRVEPTNVRINNVTQWAVHYTFPDFTGRQQESKSDYMAPDAAQQWQPGDSGTVLYDSRRPEVSLWIGRELS